MNHDQSKSTRHFPGRILLYTKFSRVPNRAPRCLRSDPLPGKIHLEGFTARLNKQCKYRQNCRFPFRDFYRRPLRTPIDLHACNGSLTRLVDRCALLAAGTITSKIWPTEEESMVPPVAPDLPSSPLRLNPHQALRQRGQDARGSRMSCARYVRAYRFHLAVIQ